jgi:hypothetical protein
MKYKNPIADVFDDPTVPNKLLAKVEQNYKELLYIDIVRVDGSTTKTVNQIKFDRTAEGHPEADVLAICEAVMQGIYYSASEDGLTTYRALIFITDNAGGRPQKRTVTINKRELALLMDEEGSENGSHQETVSNSVAEEAFAMVKEVMALNTSFHSEALNGMMEQNRELHDRLLEHSRNATMGNENMQRLLGSMTDQIREAGIQKDRALSILHASRVAEIEAEANERKWQVIAGFLGPAIQVGLARLGKGDPAVVQDVVDNIMGEEEAKVAAEAQEEGLTEEEAEAKIATQQAKLRKRIAREPTVVYLEMLNNSLSPEQWEQLEAIEPSEPIDLLKQALAMTEEAKAKETMTKVGHSIFGNPGLLEKFGEILTEDQASVVKVMFSAVTEGAPTEG